MKFDDEYTSPQAEGNLPFPPLSFVRESTVRQGGDAAWSDPHIHQSSILSRPMRNYRPSLLPAPTLNSFAAFSGADIRHLEPWGSYFHSFGVTEEEATAASMLDTGSAPAPDPSASNPTDPEYHVDVSQGYTINQVPVAQAAATKNNWITDSLSGIVKAFTPVAQRYISGTGQSAQMQQYLQGKLPGYTLGPNGQLVKSTNWIPIVIGAAVVLGVMTMMSRK